MLIRKLFKRSEPVPAPAAKATLAPKAKPANSPEHDIKERRSFPRPLPVPEVQEQDWSTWVDLSERKTSQTE
ncbi:hypothetical protein HUU62_04000 [Rhodoferax sp. 4810]|nr:hypothetical protein [Rhodoferax jenense]